MRRLLAAAWLLALAGCAQAPGGEPSLDWRTSVRGEELVVQLADRRAHYRVAQVALVAPSGRRYPAFELTREVLRDDDGYGYGRPGVGIGGAVGSGGWSSAGVGVTIPLGGFGGGPRGAWTEARIPLPKPASAVGPDWKIVVELTDRSGAQRFAELPAPAVPQ